MYMRKFFTDGSAEPNPGLGGFAVILNQQPVALGREADSTNIRMEGQALLAAYALAKDGDQIISDSRFWLDVLKKWAPAWQSAGWKKKRGEIKNLALVQALYTAYCRKPQVKLVWTAAHVGTLGNELADQWANRARLGWSLVPGQKEPKPPKTNDKTAD